jgi:hypothetical protein
MLHQGFSLSKELGGYGIALIGAVKRFLGRVASTTLEIFLQYLR